MNSLQGHFLIASPDLKDPNFFHSIVLLVNHSEEGALGLVLNRPSQTSIKSAWEQACDSACVRDEAVLVGGPCPGPLMALHQKALLSDATVLEGVYLSQSPELLEKLVADSVGPLRLFVGYAGWGSEQLEAEIAEGAWQILPASAETVFAPLELEWEPLLRRAGGASFYSSLGFRHIPDDPNMN